MNTSQKAYCIYEILLGLCITVMLACDTLAFATVDFYGFKLSASGVIFPLDFLLLGVATDAYGYKASGRIVWYMVFSQLLFIVLVNTISVLGHKIDNSTQAAYFFIYHSMWKLIFSSSTAILISYFINDFFVSFSKIKVKFLEQKTIIRILLSSAISQAILVTISYPINLYGIYKYSDIFSIAFNTWIYKMICILVLIPIISILVLLIKKVDKSDAYDIGINYNPFLVFRK